MLSEQTCFKNTDSGIILTLFAEQHVPQHISAIVDDSYQTQHTHPAITRCKLYVNAIVGDSSDSLQIIDSQDHPTWFDFTVPYSLVMLLGLATLKAGRHVTQIHIWESGSPAGVLWGEIMLVVKEIPVVPIP